LAAKSGKPQTVQRFSGIVRAPGRPINNRPQVANLPHMAARHKFGTGKIVATREDLN